MNEQGQDRGFRRRRHRGGRGGGGGGGGGGGPQGVAGGGGGGGPQGGGQQQQQQRQRQQQQQQQQQQQRGREQLPPDRRPRDRQQPAPQPPPVQEKEPGPREIGVPDPELLGATPVPEEAFEEELFVAHWEPGPGYRRTAHVMLPLVRSIITADAGDFTLAGGEEVSLSTDRGIELGRVLLPPAWTRLEGEAKATILRVVGQSDVRQMSRNTAKEAAAFESCRELIARLRLDMKLLRAQYLHGGGRVIFYFSARQRVDFRTLVKELHAQLHVRVELKQIGVRDATKMEGGIGPCGQQVCCNRFLTAFKPVSIRMVKEQNMSMNPQKISGICGRLLCCLEYEYSDYSRNFYRLPATGARVGTPDGEGVVQDLDVLRELVRVQDAEGGSRWWEAAKLKFTPQNPEKVAAAAAAARAAEIEEEQ